ncbi:MAG: GatB/YqeY domain-containing protein [Planctomycetota bacterium]
MAGYFDRVQADMKVALKAGDKASLEVLRMLLSDMNKKADSQPAPLSEADELAVLQRAVKTRADTVQQATAAGRAEIARKEQAEIEVVQRYLPKQMSAEEVAAKVQALATEIGYAGGKDTGRFMKEWMARHQGVADGKQVQAALRALA